MASPQRENGFTSYANELLERIILFDFPSASPLKIWLFISRKTYGFQKKIDHISLSQLVAGTNLSRQTVNDSLKWLVKRCLLVKGEISQKGTVYGINKDYEQWVVKRGRLVKSRPFQVVKRGRHTKETLTKEILVPKGTEIKFMYKEPTIQLDELGDEITSIPIKESFGKWTAEIAKFYCMLVGKTSASAQLKASKELFKISQAEFPNDTIDQWVTEIKGRITVASKYYQIKGVKDWNLQKVAENWNKILIEWNKEIKKYQ